MICVTIDIPDGKLSPNGRTKWQVKMGLTKKAKAAAKDAAQAAAYDYDLREPIESPIVQVVRYMSARHKVCDPDNLLAQLKPSIDGMTQAGIWRDDEGIIYLPPIQRRDRKRPRLEIWAKTSSWTAEDLRKMFFPEVALPWMQEQIELELDTEKPF